MADLEVPKKKYGASQVKKQIGSVSPFSDGLTAFPAVADGRARFANGAEKE